MNQFGDLFSNYVLNVTILSWLIAQVIKTLLAFVKTKKFNLERMVGAGGMPSCHSASVCGLTVSIARSVGISSPMFAIAFLFAAVVMHDAMGVRRAAGEQAKVINMIVKREKAAMTYKPQDQRKLKEILGHTPMEVLGGALLGIVIAMLIPVK